MLLIAAGVLAWTFIFNKGVLIVEGMPPFNIKVGERNLLCNAQSCELKLGPQKYNAVISKEGFFDDIEPVEIKIGGKTKLAARFKLIPALREIGDMVLPVQSAPLRPPFLGAARLENFPRNPKAALFSASGNIAMVTLGKEIYLYDVQKKSLDKIGVDPNAGPVFAGENIYFLDKTDSREILKEWDSAEKSEEVVSFARPFKNSSLIGGAPANRILLEDKAGSSTIFYLIDAEKKSRKRIYLDGNPEKAKLLSAGVAFEINGGDEKNVVIVNYETLAQMSLPAVNTDNLTEKSSGTLLFLSATRLDPNHAKLGYSISEILNEAQKENFDLKKTATALFLTEFNPASGKYSTILDIPADESDSLLNLTLSEDGKKVYFVKSKKLFEVLLEK